MKKIVYVFLFLLSLTLLVGCKESTDVKALAEEYFETYPDAGSYLISWTDLFAKIDAGDDLFIVDIRSNADYAINHVDGAYNAAWGVDLASKVERLPKDQTVYVYCYSGQTAGQTIALLRLLGIDAYSVKSGYVNGGAATHTEFLSNEASEMPDAGAKFDQTTLTFVKDYFNDIPSDGSHIITANDARLLIEAGDVTVVDIRSAEDFALGHIDGAINIPFGKGMQSELLNLPIEHILVACYSGQTAGQTIAILRAMGYQADSIKFGMSSTLDGWATMVRKNAANAFFANYPASGNYLINWADIYTKIDAEEQLVIVDIRAAVDYDVAHIKGAINAPFGVGLADKIEMLPTDQPVYVYCYSGQTAGQAIALLRMLGVEAYSIKSGFTYGGAVDQTTYHETTVNTMADADDSFDPFLLSYVKTYLNDIATSGSHIISAVSAKPQVDAGTATVIDIRSAADYAISHVDNAVNLPFGVHMEEGFSNLPAGQLYVACYSGQTAGQTIAVLRALGYQADSIKFGMSATLDGWFHNFPPAE
jgi:rhodanese-related sulfurtransferase